MKQMEYTVKVITDGTIDTKALETAIKGAQEFKVVSADVTNFRVVKQSKA